MDHSDPDGDGSTNGDRPEKLTAEQRHGARYGSTSSATEAGSSDASGDESGSKNRDRDPIA